MRILLAFVLACAACQSTYSANPAASTGLTPLQTERYVRRLYFDLTGAAPAPVELDAARAQLDAGQGKAAARLALVDALLATPAFATTYVRELQNRMLAGEMLDDRYALLCLQYRNFDKACQTCGPPGNETDLCDCNCPAVQSLVTERALLRAATDDLARGTPSADVEKRHATSQLFLFSFADQDTFADGLFTTFLGRDPSADERRNAGAMGFAQPGGGPRGLLFHQLGADLSSLGDILFASEVYREAIVDAVFQRYLGRSASVDERAVFTAKLDAAHPDLRPVVRAVVASREYLAP